jgi:hypothetical protein
MADEPDAVCDFCGKPVVPAPTEVDVLEGEKRFHLACYRLSKHQSLLQPPKSN